MYNSISIYIYVCVCGWGSLFPLIKCFEFTQVPGFYAIWAATWCWIRLPASVDMLIY